MNQIKKLGLVLVFHFFTIAILGSCHKSPGAICMDGHRSYSTGRGTCSWHGGVDHYIDTNEISIPSTIALVLVLGLGGIAIFGGNNSSKKK